MPSESGSGVEVDVEVDAVGKGAWVARVREMNLGVRESCSHGNKVGVVRISKQHMISRTRRLDEGRCKMRMTYPDGRSEYGSNKAHFFRSDLV